MPGISFSLGYKMLEGDRDFVPKQTNIPHGRLSAGNSQLQGVVVAVRIASEPQKKKKQPTINVAPSVLVLLECPQQTGPGKVKR